MKKIEVKEWDMYWKLKILKEINQSNLWRKFECECNCWNIKDILLCSLRNWRTTSCWCVHKELLIKNNILNKTIHWKTKNRIYRINTWLLQRCNNPKSTCYENYWLRWIKSEWKTFNEFNKDMWESYEKYFKENDWDTTIEREDNDWNYCKSNCVWATMKEQ